MSGETKFSVMCSLFNWIQKSKSSTKKRSKFRKFLDTYCKPTDYFAAVRLILPNLDRERGSYGLKESVLATCIIDALCMSRESPDALRLINWRKGGAKIGVNVGNFSLVASEVLQRRQGMISGGLTIKELNDLLDRLASSENRAEKISVLSDLIKKTNAQEMKWIIMIILKDLKLGISEKSIFHEFHPDAEDLFNVTCDLKLVCERLRDRRQRHKRQDIEVGKAVRPQLALRVANAASAWKKLHGKEVVIECKFDGDRIQIHKNGEDIHFFSRNFLDHPEYTHGMSNIIIQNVLVDRCILDGEMLVWDTSNGRFAEFGSNQEIAKAAREGLASERQLCYVAFDILYDGDTSVIHQTLKERHELLKKVVKPVKGRLEILVPDGGLNVHTTVGEPCWSQVAHNVSDVETFFKRTIENRDEGIVLKDLGSKWEPSDRSGKWLKLKPEYVRAGADLDVLIIGGYYGSGRRGGQVAQFLMGLAERPASNTYPRRFISFCRVGTGLSDEELDAVVNKLKPYFRKYEYPKKGPPSYYKVTNNSKERPDVWIDSPEKSIILSITSDIRTIRSEVFAAPYSLRFPRIDKVRDDKPWHECLDVESFVELVHSSNHTTQWGGSYEKQQENKPKRSKSSRTDKKSGSVVPSHLLQTDVSQIKGETLIFSNMMFYFVNVPSTHSLDSLHKMVAENGGTFSMNLNNSVTHCIAAESRGIKFQAAKRHGDVIHYSWLLDCCSQKKLVPLHPKYFLVLSESSKKKSQEEIDEFSDAYYLDIDIKDMKQLLNNINRSEDSKTIDYYKKKYCPLDKWSRFNGCCMYFYKPANRLGSDWEALLELTMRRMKLEICFAGGKVSSSLSNATHLVVMSLPGFNVDFDTIVKSFSASERRMLRNKNLHMVNCQWLEDSFEKDLMLQEEEYSLRPTGFTESTSSDEHALEPSLKQEYIDEKKNTVNLEVPTSDKDGRKKGRPINTKTSSRGRTGLNPRQRTRARSGNKAVKIHEYVSDDDESHVKDDEKGHQEMQDAIVEDMEPLEKAVDVSSNAKVTTEYSGKMGDDDDANKEINTKTNTRGRTSLNPRRRTRTRSQAVKIHEYVSDDDDDESHVKDNEKGHHEMQDATVEDMEPLEKAVDVSSNAKVTTEYSGKMGDNDDANKEINTKTNTRGRTGLNPRRRTRTRSQAVKIHEYVSDDDDDDESHVKDDEKGHHEMQDAIIENMETLEKAVDVSSNARVATEYSGKMAYDDDANKEINTKTNTRGRTSLNPRRRTRTRSGNKAVKIHEYVSDDDDDESHVKDDEKGHHEMQDAIVEDMEPLEKAIDVSPNAEVTTEYSGKIGDDDDANKESDKLEVMVDPVQAMLLDMIPSLEPKTENKTTMDPPPAAAKRENPSLDPNNPGPSKKKKVSYKDLAMELLKD